MFCYRLHLTLQPHSIRSRLFTVVSRSKSNTSVFRRKRALAVKTKATSIFIHISIGSPCMSFFKYRVLKKAQELAHKYFCFISGMSIPTATCFLTHLACPCTQAGWVLITLKTCSICLANHSRTPLLIGHKTVMSPKP